MRRVSLAHVRRIVEAWSMTENRDMDKSEVFEPSPSAKMAWRSNFTLAVFSLTSC